MCTYVTLVAPTTETQKLDAFMRKRGRRAESIANASVASLLHAGEHQFLIAAYHCDCGTILARPGLSEAEQQDALRRERERLARKGWSSTKIERALSDQRQSHEHKHEHDEDIAYWADLVCDALGDLSLRSIGLLVHDYSGNLTTEEINARREEIRLDATLGEKLARLEADTLLVVTR